MSNQAQKNSMDPAKGQFLVYRAEDGTLKLDVRFEDDSVWLTQTLMAELFQTTKQNVSSHVQRIFAEEELMRKPTVKKLLTVQSEGNRQVKRVLEYYNLDVIISVGYRVKSRVATRFRIWATQKLMEFIKKGFVIDDDRLKEPEGGRYFEELLARIRDIRSSEKMFWRKVLDIYATSVDYDPENETSMLFFKQVQNKMHWAAHGHTAAELIYDRADAEKPNMGVTHFPGKRLLKRDVEVAKNYLDEKELSLLNRMVTAYLEVAEIQALNQTPMTMNDWAERLNQFLSMTGRDLLTHTGKISREVARDKAHTEYDKFKARLLMQPTEVEKHFIIAEKAFKSIESVKPTSS